MVLIIFGLPGSGKSYLAQRVAYELNADYVNSDLIRKKMLKRPTYDYSEKLQIYAQMYEAMYEHKKAIKDLVIDATFFRKSLRDSFKTLASDLNIDLKWVEVVCDRQIVEKRLAKKRSYSDADLSVYEKLVKEFEPFADDHLTLKSTNDNIDDLLEQVKRYVTATTKGMT